MAKQSHHWFPFYYEKFIIGTSGMSDAQVGAYVRLLIMQFDKGGIPANDKRLKSEVVRGKFELKQDGLFYNHKMEEVRDEQADLKTGASERGKKGAEKRWLKHSQATVLPMANYSQESKVKENKGKESTRGGLEIEFLKTEFENAGSWHFILKRDLGIHPNLLPNQFKEFFKEVSGTQEFLNYKELQDAQRHFFFWIKKRIEKDKPATTTTNFLGKYGK